MSKPFQESLCVITDDTFRETVQHGNESYPFAYYLEDIWQFDFHCIDWHWHHEVEFLLVEEGTAHCYIGTDQIELPKGYGLFVNSSILHRYEAAGRILIPNIVFSPSLLAAEKSLIYEKHVQPVINSSVAYQVFSPKTDWQNRILQILTDIFRLQESSRRKELQTVSLLLSLWDILFEHLILTSELPDIHRTNNKQARLQIMMQYIHEHYSEQITLEHIAATVSISKSGALQIFQSGIHLPPVSYLIQYRLMCAAKLLYTTEKPVSAIAEETGFTSSGYFCRKFKERYHMSPNTYRKKKLFE